MAKPTPLQHGINVYHAISFYHIFSLPFLNPWLATQDSLLPSHPLSRPPTFGGRRPLLDPELRRGGGNSCRPFAQSREMQKEGKEGRRTENDGKPSICCLSWILILTTVTCDCATFVYDLIQVMPYSIQTYRSRRYRNHETLLKAIVTVLTL